MHLTADQEDQILCSYEGMHRMLVKCAEERNTVILPQLGMAGVEFSKARPSKIVRGRAKAFLKLEEQGRTWR